MIGPDMTADTKLSEPDDKWMSFLEDEKQFYRSIAFN